MGILDLLLGGSGNGAELKIGDKVRVKYREQEGYIIGKDGDLFEVSINDG